MSYTLYYGRLFMVLHKVKLIVNEGPTNKVFSSQLLR